MFISFVILCENYILILLLQIKCSVLLNIIMLILSKHKIGIPTKIIGTLKMRFQNISY